MTRAKHGYLWLFLSLFYIVHCFRQVFRTTSRNGTELLYVGSSWSSCLCSALWRGHRSTSLMNSSLLLLQYPSCLVRLTLMVSLWVLCAVQLLLCRVVPLGLVQYCSQHYSVVASSFFSLRLLNIHVVHPYSSIDTTVTWKKLRFILLVSTVSIWLIAYR